MRLEILAGTLLFPSAKPRYSFKAGQQYFLHIENSWQYFGISSPSIEDISLDCLNKLCVTKGDYEKYYKK